MEVSKIVKLAHKEKIPFYPETTQNRYSFQIGHFGNHVTPDPMFISWK